MRRLSPRGEAGVTLIELLLVMTIVAIIATIAYPSYETAKVRARMGSLTANLNAMEHALYDHNLAKGHLPPTNHLEYLVIDGFIPEIPNDPFTTDLPREQGPLGGWGVEDRGDYLYVNDIVGGKALLWPESHPGLVVTIVYRR